MVKPLHYNKFKNEVYISPCTVHSEDGKGFFYVMDVLSDVICHCFKLN